MRLAILSIIPSSKLGTKTLFIIRPFINLSESIIKPENTDEQMLTPLK